MGGLILTPERTFADAPRLNVLVVPGGPGQQRLMDDQAVLGFLRRQAADARCVLSVCTGALTCGAAGLLQGVRATTHWSAFHLLRYFGAIPVDEHVVVDGHTVSAAGVTSGMDGALWVAAMLRGDTVAQRIQLAIQYAPSLPAVLAFSAARLCGLLVSFGGQQPWARRKSAAGAARRRAGRLARCLGGSG
jgi:cyclohexyl-isocyanide hydratase